jgi:hypothetical protein
MEGLWDQGLKGYVLLEGDPTPADGGFVGRSGPSIAKVAGSDLRGWIFFRVFWLRFYLKPSPIFKENKEEIVAVRTGINPGLTAKP